MTKARFLRSALTATGVVATALLAGLTPMANGAAAAAIPSVKPAATRPNIVVILIDDMGFSDISSFGGEIPTPNIDALGAGGLKFTQFYNNARCSPSRAALLTGAYPHQTGMGHLEAIAVPGSQGLHGKLEPRVVTMAEVLGSAGYYTAMSGKWHLGITRGVTPWDRGFQHSFVSPVGELYYRDQPGQWPKNVYIDGKEYLSSADEVGGKDYWYSSDLFVQWQGKFIDQAKAAKKPFFLYMPFVATHFPLMAPPEDVARFKGKYMAGWEKLRQARFEREKALGIIDANTKLPPLLPNSYEWDKLSAADKDRFDTIMAVYAATVSRMDRAVGDLVAKLKATGEFDNTLILFMNDNGGNAESGPDGRLQGMNPGSAKSNIFVGMNWASMQNAPFSYFKHFTEEGGIATPLVVSWPNGIDKKLDGNFVREPGHLIDVMATAVEVSGATYPKTFNGNAIVPLQGRSMAPAFQGKALKRDKPIFIEHEGNRAVRDGKWKLVARFQQPWQLFDMSVDRTELNDLAKSDPAMVKKMSAQWDAWAKASYVDPWKDSYDVYLKGGTRQNWGGDEKPQHPEAMRPGALTGTK